MILLIDAAFFPALFLVRFGSLMHILLQTKLFLFVIFLLWSSGSFDVFPGCYVFSLSQHVNTPLHTDLHIYINRHMGNHLPGFYVVTGYSVVLVPCNT